MKKLKGILVLVLLMALLASPVAVLASNVEGARFYALIQVSNNGTAVTNEITTCNISTTNLINGGFLNSSANNCALQSSAGTDLPFMPGVNDDPWTWCLWVPAMGADSVKTDILYTANTTGGKIRYFPGAGGMTAVDSTSLELGDNFTVEQSGWWNTDNATDKNAVYKEKAFKTYVSPTVTGNITSAIYLGTVWVSPTGNVNPGSWANPTNAYDGVIANKAEKGTAGSGDWTGYLELTHAAIATDRLRFYISTSASTFDNFVEDIDAFYDGDWQDIGQSSYAFNTWIELDIPGVPDVTSIRFQMQNNVAAARTCFLHELDYGVVGYLEVSATGVESGERTVTTSANITHLAISVYDEDNVLIVDDTTVLTANVTDNSANWTFCQNNVMPYMEYQTISVNGTQVQYIDWEYDTTFSDNSSFGNDATPSFRSASSDADVSAEFISFLPVSEAQAPAYVLEEGVDFIESVPVIVSEWDVEPPAGTFPLAGVIVAVADATDTPPQLPLVIIAGFTIIALSLAISSIMRKYGSGTIFVKLLVIVGIMGVFVGIGNFGIDFWMIFVFAIIGVALSMASRHVSWQ